MELFKLFGTIAVNNDEANQNIDETTGKAEGAESKMSAAFKKIGAAVAAAFAVDKIIAFGKSITEAAATVAAEQSAFEQIMGDYSNTAQQKVNEIADATGMVSTRLTPYMTSMTAKFKGLGYDIEDATTLASGGLNLAADAAAFWDKSLDDSMSALNSFINGSYEGGEAIGLFANDTQMAQYAIKTGLVDTTAAWSSLDEATKQATRLEYAQAMFEQSGATGQAAKEANQYANVQANLTEKWRQFKAEIGEPVLQNIVLPAMDKLSGLVDSASTAFQNLSTWVQENHTALSNIAEIAVYATGVFIAFKAAMAIQSVIQGFQQAKVALSMLSLEIGGANLAQAALNGTLTVGETIVGLLTGKIKLAAVAQGLMTKAQAALNAIMSANPIAIVIVAITALVAAFIYLWNNCESFRNFWIGLWDGIKEIAKAVADWFKQAWTDIGNFFTTTVPGWFNSFKEFFVNLWNEIKEFFVNLWNEIKDFITNVWNSIIEFLTPILEGIKNTFTTVFNAIKDVVTNVFNAVKDFITNVWNGIKNTITNVVNSIKNTVSNVFNSVKSTVINIFDSMKSKVTSIWNGVKTAIQTSIDGAKNIVKSGLDAIKGFFDKLQIKFPHIKLPHFSITGSFSLDPPSVPHLSVDWYAKAMDNAMLLNSPTIFGMNGAGQLMGGGEAGQEVVAGSNTLMGMIRGAVQTETSGVADRLERLISMLAEYLPEITLNANRQIVLDTGVLAGQLAPTMDSKLGDISRLRGRGR